MRNRTRIVIPLCIAAFALSLTGCSTTTPVPPHTTTPAPVLVQPTSIPTDVPNQKAARANVQITDCAGRNDSWVASGNARNPGNTDTTYDITIFFTTSAATVVQTGHTTVHVPAGKTGKWSVSGKVQAEGKILCVLRGAATR